MYRGCAERHWVLFLSIAGLYCSLSPLAGAGASSARSVADVFFIEAPMFAVLAFAALLSDFAGDKKLLLARNKSYVWRALAPLLPEEVPAASMLTVCYLAATFAVATFFTRALAPPSATDAGTGLVRVERWLPVCLLLWIAGLAWRGHVFRASVLGSTD